MKLQNVYSKYLKDERKNREILEKIVGEGSILNKGLKILELENRE